MDDLSCAIANAAKQIRAEDDGLAHEVRLTQFDSGLNIGD